jgi:hypothetical protein
VSSQIFSAIDGEFLQMLEEIKAEVKQNTRHINAVLKELDAAKDVSCSAT